MKNKNIHEEIILAIERAILTEGKAVIGPTDIKIILNRNSRGRKLHYETAKKVLKEFILSYKLIKNIEEEGYNLSYKFIKNIPFITAIPKDAFQEISESKEPIFSLNTKDENSYMITFKDITLQTVMDRRFKVEQEV